MNEQVEEILRRLKALKRYDVGTGDDGDGYHYDYEDVREDGAWVDADDVDKLVRWIEGKGASDE